MMIIMYAAGLLNGILVFLLIIISYKEKEGNLIIFQYLVVVVTIVFFIDCIFFCFLFLNRYQSSSVDQGQYQIDDLSSEIMEREVNKSEYVTIPQNQLTPSVVTTVLSSCQVDSITNFPEQEQLSKQEPPDHNECINIQIN